MKGGFSPGALAVAMTLSVCLNTFAVVGVMGMLVASLYKPHYEHVLLWPNRSAAVANNSLAQQRSDFLAVSKQSLRVAGKQSSATYWLPTDLPQHSPNQRLAVDVGYSRDHYSAVWYEVDYSMTSALGGRMPTPSVFGVKFAEAQYLSMRRPLLGMPLLYAQFSEMSRRAATTLVLESRSMEYTYPSYFGGHFTAQRVALMPGVDATLRESPDVIDLHWNAKLTTVWLQTNEPWSVTSAYLLSAGRHVQRWIMAHTLPEQLGVLTVRDEADGWSVQFQMATQNGVASASAYPPTSLDDSLASVTSLRRFPRTGQPAGG